MTRNKSPRPTFTAYPNLYTDTIKPTLSDTQRDVMDIVIRMTIGWHKESAHISNTTFVTKTGKSERAIQIAKKQLLEMGLLIMLESAKGTIPAKYKIDLHYNDPKPTNIEPVAETAADPVEAHPIQNDVELLDTKIDSDDASQHPENELPLIPQPTPIPTNEDIESSTDNDNTPIVSEITDADNEPSPEIADNILDDSNTESSTDNGLGAKEMQGRGERNAPLPYSSTKYTNKYIKQTMKHSETKQRRDGSVKSPIGVVCYRFTNLFPEAKDDSTWRFIGWCIKTYGEERCTEKLNYLQEYKKLHPIENPKGLLRMALARDYQPPRHIAGMIKARRKAELAVEHGQTLMAEREQWKEESTDWNAGAMAISNIIATLGRKETEDE